MIALNQGLLTSVLYLLGAGFLVFNLYLFFQYFRNRRLQRSALVTWPPPRPPLFRLFLWVGAVLAIVIYYKLAVLRLHPKFVFGETMMLVYYVYAMPLGLKIRRGLYEDGPRIAHPAPSLRAAASDRTKSVSIAIASSSEGPAVLSTTTWSRRYSARISSMGRRRVRVARIVASSTALRARL